MPLHRVKLIQTVEQTALCVFLGLALTLMVGIGAAWSHYRHPIRRMQMQLAMQQQQQQAANADKKES